MALYLVRLVNYPDRIEDSVDKRREATVKSEYEVEYDTFDEALAYAKLTTPETELGDQLGVFWSKNNTEVR